MIPPKYKFYIFRGLSGDINRGYVVSNSTGAVSSGYNTAHSVTQLLSVADYDDIRILTTLYNSCYLCEYDKNNVFIGKKSLSKSTSGLILNSNTAFIRLQFYILNDSLTNSSSVVIGGHLVNPHYKDLSKKYAKESGQEFFRISLDGKINLFGQDCEFIRNSGLEDRFIFIIDKYNRTSGEWTEYYKGEFNKTDCKFDYSKKKCELKTTAIDNYNEVMNKYENTYDLIKLAPEITKINMHKRPLMQVYVLGANSISNFFGGTYWEDDVNETIDDHNALINKYYFSYIKAGNEFYIRNAGLSEVNGVYAGTNGYWSNWNGYTCYLDLTEANPNNICIKRNSDNTILYKSEKTWSALDVNDIYIGREDIVMVNVNNSADKFTIQSPFVYRIYRRLLCDVDYVTDSEGKKNTYDLPADDFVTNNRNYKKCIGLTGGLFFCTSRAVDEPTKYGLNDYGQYFTNQFIPPSTGLERPLPISRNSWANASLWYVYDSYYSLFEQRLRKQYTLKDSWSIAAVIKALLKQIDPTLKHEATAEYSRFLYDESTPFSFARFYVHLTQKTNILKGDYDQPAQKAEISLEELTKMLRDCFRCYWYIEDDKFKVEHVLFFINGGAYTTGANTQLDFTKLTDQFNKKLSSYFQSEIEYDKTDLAQRYEFNWMDDATELFGGVTLDVKSNYVQKDKVEEINASQFSADVDYMLFNPSAFSNDGFALLCPIKKDIIDVTTLQYTRHTVREYYSPIGTPFENCKMDSTTRVTSSELISINGDVTVTVTNSLFKIFILEFDADGLYTRRYYGYVTYGSPLTLRNIARLSLTISYVSDEEILPSDVTSQGAAIATCRLSNYSYELPIISTRLIDENKDMYTATAQNWYASWIYLTSKFYIYDMPAPLIQSNALGDLYATVKMCMKHTIEFPIEEDLDELELIKTTIGNGKIDEISVNVNTRHAKVRLLYAPQ